MISPFDKLDTYEIRLNQITMELWRLLDDMEHGDQKREEAK